MSRFLQIIAKYIGLPLAERLLAAIVAYLKKQWKKSKVSKARKAQKKKDLENAKKYETSGNPDDFDKLP